VKEPPPQLTFATIDRSIFPPPLLLLLLPPRLCARRPVLAPPAEG
jgi:hypothetical protein